MRYQRDRLDSIRYTIGIFAIIFLTVLLFGCVPHTIEVTPPVDVNEPGTQHEITATVTDEKGRPVPHSRVDWILPRSELGVGDIVATGDAKPAYPHPKKTNTYAKTRTDFYGKSKITITSPQTGKTSIVAVAKGIKDTGKHKDHAIKYWVDLDWEFPPHAVNQAGTPHEMKVRVYKKSPNEHTKTDDDLRNYRVEWELVYQYEVTEQLLAALQATDMPVSAIDQLSQLRAERLRRSQTEDNYLEKSDFIKLVSERIGQELFTAYETLMLRHAKSLIGPDAYFDQNGSDRVTTQTRSDGETNVTLRQVLPKDGQNKIRIRLKLPDKLPAGLDKVCCPKPNDFIAQADVVKTWQTPTITILKSCLDKVALGDTTRFDIEVKNDSPFVVTSLFVRDKIPPGFTYQSASPGRPNLIQQPKKNEVDGTVSWTLQTLQANTSAKFHVELQAAFAGIFVNTVRATTPNTTRFYDASCTTEIVQPDLQAWKFCPPRATVNEPFFYSYVIKNPGTTDIENVVAWDTLPPGVRPFPDPNTALRWAIGRLRPEQQHEGSFAVIADNTLLPGGSAYGGQCKVNGKWFQGRSVTNTIDAEGEWVKTRGIETVNSQETCTTCIQPEQPPALLLEVVDLYDTVPSGDTSVYRITVTNQDKRTVKNINVAAWLPQQYNDDRQLIPNEYRVSPLLPRFSERKIRRLKSARDEEPFKRPQIELDAKQLWHFPDKMIAQALRETLREMLWKILRAELATQNRRPESIPSEALHRRLALKLDHVQSHFMGQIRLQKGDDDAPITVSADDAQDYLEGQILILLRELLQDVLSQKDLGRLRQPMTPSQVVLLSKEQTLDKFKELLPVDTPLPQRISAAELERELRHLWPIDKWPLDDIYLGSRRWITFKEIPELQQYWRATYYVEVQAEQRGDVRFIAIMTADEHLGPVVETESTHLVHR